jgi:predicted DNA-binding transcriptional regulator YafY
MTNQHFQPAAALPNAPAERQEGAWRVLPLEGAFEIAYEDGRGLRSIRRLFARELKVGPGKTLLGGVDRDRDGYRGFRADRIRRLTDPESGERIERNVVDWLIRRAERTARALNAARKAAERSAAKVARQARGGAPAPL